MNTLRQIRFIWKPLVFLLCLVPAILIVTDLNGLTGTLGANPVEAMLDRFGNWAIRFIMIALAVTPAAKADRLELAEPVSTHARPVRILLRPDAFPRLADARSRSIFLRTC